MQGFIQNINFLLVSIMPMRGGELLLRRLSINLHDNAIKYNREASFRNGQKDKNLFRVTVSSSDFIEPIKSVSVLKNPR